MNEFDLEIELFKAEYKINLAWKSNSLSQSLNKFGLEINCLRQDLDKFGSEIKLFKAVYNINLA